VAQYFLYFDRSDFIYTGITGTNKHILSFSKSILTSYVSNELQYPKRFAEYALNNKRLSENAYKAIKSNKDLQIEVEKPLRKKLEL
jgi:hypothetical protein